MPLNGIDISSWQADLVPAAMTTTDFVIVKATGGVGYKNPCFKKHMDQSIEAGKLVGCYHFAQERGCKGSAVAEADYFAEAVKPYLGKAILVLDWEEDAIARGTAYAKAWLDRVYQKTKVKPLIYMSKSVANAYNWREVANTGYGLWVAQYPNYNFTGYKKLSDIWADGSGFGAWSTWDIFQYTSVGRIKGYGGNLDLDCYRGDRAGWLALAGGSVVTKVKSLLSFDKSDVKRAQKYYKKLKVYSGKIDGEVGKLTEAARVKAMQKAMNAMGAKLKIDGVCGSLTKKAFEKYQSNAATDPAMVKAIQAAVITHGYDCGDIDGDYGKYAQQAVKAFQMAHDLKADCIVGPKTFEKLF